MDRNSIFRSSFSASTKPSLSMATSYPSSATSTADRDESLFASFACSRRAESAGGKPLAPLQARHRLSDRGGRTDPGEERPGGADNERRQSEQNGGSHTIEPVVIGCHDYYQHRGDWVQHDQPAPG